MGDYDHDCERADRLDRAIERERSNGYQRIRDYDSGHYRPHDDRPLPSPHDDGNSRIPSWDD